MERLAPSDWLDARVALLAAEKAHMREADRLAEARRALPHLPVPGDYRFTDANAEVTLSDLFGVHSQLFVYHFMFPEEWGAGCKSCSYWADNMENLAPHLAARDAALVMTSAAPFAQLDAFRKKMGWTTRWLSETDLSFGSDMGVRFSEEQRTTGGKIYNFGSSGFGIAEAPGISIFQKEGDQVYLTYQTFGRGLEQINAAYGMLDLLPKGRDEDGKGMAWLRHRTEY